MWSLHHQGTASIQHMGRSGRSVEQGFVWCSCRFGEECRGIRFLRLAPQHLQALVQRSTQRSDSISWHYPVALMIFEQGGLGSAMQNTQIIGRCLAFQARRGTMTTARSHNHGGPCFITSAVSKEVRCLCMYACMGVVCVYVNVHVHLCIYICTYLYSLVNFVNPGATWPSS